MIYDIPTLGFIIVGAFLCELIDSSLGMMYGTILSPVLIIAGLDPLVVVPSILFSQAIGGFVASIRHQQLNNVNFSVKKDIMNRLYELGYLETFKRSTTRDLKVAFVVTSFGIIATVISALIAINIPTVVLKMYIGILVCSIGIVLLLRSKFNFTWKKILGIGILSAFNKGISGGGFGPVVTSGQLISGRDSKESIGVTTLSEAPICIAGFLTYLLKNGLSTWDLIFPLTIGASIGAVIGPYITKKFKSEKKIRLSLGILVTFLGIWTLIKTCLV